MQNTSRWSVRRTSRSRLHLLEEPDVPGGIISSFLISSKSTHGSPRTPPPLSSLLFGSFSCGNFKASFPTVPRSPVAMATGGPQIIGTRRRSRGGRSGTGVRKDQGCSAAPFSSGWCRNNEPASSHVPRFLLPNRHQVDRLCYGARIEILAVHMHEPLLC